MRIEWATGATRYVWVNGNVDDTGLWEGLEMWSDRTGIVYTPAASLGEAQIIVVEPGEYATAFGVSGFIGHNTTITDDGTGFGMVSYMTAADDTGAWDRAAVWAHEAGHAEGEGDILGAADSLYSYTDIHDEPSQLDTERWQSWFGPNDGSTAFHAGDGGTVSAGIRGGGGDDTIWGDGGDDVLYGNAGDDVLDGGEDGDTLYGGQGNDAIAGGDDADVLYGNLGNDTLEGGAGADWLHGGQGDDVVYGGAGDTIFGGVGADTLYAHPLAVIGQTDPADTILEWIGA